MKQTESVQTIVIDRRERDYIARRLALASNTKLTGFEVF